MRTALILAFAALPLAACDSGSEPAPESTTEPATEPAAADPAAPDAATPSPTPEPPATTEPAAIPAALRGRWGLSEADCEPGRSDATGLLTITADKLEFYESVGTLDGIEEVSESRIDADFDFTGEGTTWERDITLALEDGGQTLIRREDGVGAAPGEFRYTKCP